MKATVFLYYSAAATTIIAGLLQFLLSYTIAGVEKGNPGLSAFFIGIGLLQLLWGAGLIRKWGRTFYSLATGVNIALIFLWVILRLPQQIVGPPLRVDSVGIAIESFQILFLILCMVILSSKGEPKGAKSLSLVPPFKRDIVNGTGIPPSKYEFMKNRVAILGIGAAVLIVGLAGITYTMPEIVQKYGIKTTSTPPYTSEPPVVTPSVLYFEMGFIIVFIAGLVILSYGATLTGRVSRPKIGP
jgi:hypothetical protein